MRCVSRSPCLPPCWSCTGRSDLHSCLFMCLFFFLSVSLSFYLAYLFSSSSFSLSSSHPSSYSSFSSSSFSSFPSCFFFFSSSSFSSLSFFPSLSSSLPPFHPIEGLSLASRSFVYHSHFSSTYFSWKPKGARFVFAMAVNGIFHVLYSRPSKYE